ncbi:MAG: helix-turn-helix transcriptional regulator [candidate division NC10 bacterium]|nr:helix-turn-helix transcriptional regulator [candidate division NC10 bacterium]
MDDHLEQKAEFLKALAQPTRLKILDLLKDGERCVCDIFPAIGEQQSNVSRHLQLMKRAGVLASRKDGLRVLYRIKDGKITRLLEDVDLLFGRAGSAKGKRSAA